MKITRLIYFFTFALLCLTTSIGANAQYGYQNGSYTTDPDGTPKNPLPSGAGMACSSTTCNGSLTAAGHFYTYYTTHLVWTGTGSPTYSTTVKAWVNVSGMAGPSSGVSSRSTANSPIGVTASGSAYPNNNYNPSALTGIANQQYPQSLTGTQFCQVAGTGSAEAPADITFGFN